MTKKKLFDTVIFDLDNTLYPYHENHVRGVKAAHKIYTKKYRCSFASFLQKFMYYEEQNNKLLPKQAAAHDRRLFFQHMFEKEHNKIEYRMVLDMYEAYWHAMIKGIKLDAGVRKLFKWLKKHDIKIGLITDLTVDVQFRKIIHTKLEDAFDVIVTSEEAGIEKPHKKIFQLCLKKLGSRPQKSIMIGDNFQRDILGAQSLRMKTIWVKRDQKNETKKKPDFVVKYADDIQEILESLYFGLE
ncbi:MAG: HAD family hydrolase [Candidatus Woesearchaeota archaeon]